MATITRRTKRLPEALLNIICCGLLALPKIRCRKLTMKWAILCKLLRLNLWK